MATQATLINSAGQKVVVESGSQAAKNYFSQGYKLMDASGKPATTPTPTATNPVASAVKPDMANPVVPSSPPITGNSPVQVSGNNAPVTPIQPSSPANNAAPVATESPTTKTSSKTEQPTDFTTKPGIADLLASGRAFTEEDAKNYAYAKGESNYQQYIGGVGGSTNPLYIGTTNWAKLQKVYTPYQLQQATTRTPSGIYWKEGVNISDLPSVDPNIAINDDAKKIADIVSAAKDEAEDYSLPDKTKKDEINSDIYTDENSLISMLQNNYGANAESLYNELFNTEEMKAAQTDVMKYKSEIDEYDQQLDELKDDIRSEVEGEASESYISALATVRGDKILKMKRSAQRNYDTALANYNGLKENAINLLNIRSKDADTRYNRLFSMLQLQIQQEGTAFNQELALNQLALQMPEGRSMTIGGIRVTGLKEDDNLNVVQFTEASGKTYVIGVDKKTGAEKYRTYIGTAKVSGTGTSDEKDVDLQTALYWLSLVKNKDGGYDLNSIPADIRTGVVNAISQNKDKLPTPEKNWWERQTEDFSSGNFWNIVNPFD